MTREPRSRPLAKSSVHSSAAAAAVFRSSPPESTIGFGGPPDQRGRRTSRERAGARGVDALVDEEAAGLGDGLERDLRERSEEDLRRLLRQQDGVGEIPHAARYHRPSDDPFAAQPRALADRRGARVPRHLRRLGAGARRGTRRPCSTSAGSRGFSRASATRTAGAPRSTSRARRARAPSSISRTPFFEPTASARSGSFRLTSRN